MPTIRCALCGQEVPYDDKGMGGTLMVAHAKEHADEMKSKGMNTAEYLAYCKNKSGERLVV